MASSSIHEQREYDGACDDEAEHEAINRGVAHS
jgi:hypothetical protein